MNFSPEFSPLTMFRAGPVASNDSRPRLDRASWHAKAGILALAAGAGLVTLITFPERHSLSLTVGLAAAFTAIVYILVRDLIGATGGAETAGALSNRTPFSGASAPRSEGGRAGVGARGTGRPIRRRLPRTLSSKPRS